MAAAAGASGTFGPNLDKQLVSDAKADGNMGLAAFIRQSITNPNAYIAKGFAKPSQMPLLYSVQLSSRR